jgi:hypothetical protein
MGSGLRAPGSHGITWHAHGPAAIQPSGLDGLAMAQKASGLFLWRFELVLCLSYPLLLQPLAIPVVRSKRTRWTGDRFPAPPMGR